MAKIKAPFNFVPLNKYVFIPEWHKIVSHDIPFKDGEDGIIRFTLKNLTPLHISQGKENNVSVSYYIDYNSNKRYFIPATSIKGMIRSVAEVLSFSKLNTYNDDYFGYRIFVNSNSEDYRKYHKTMENPLCGYLVKENEEYKILSCGEPERIAIKDIETQRQRFEQEGKTLVKSGEMNSKKHEHLFGPIDKNTTHIISTKVINAFLSVYKPNKDFENKLKKLKEGEKLPVFYHLDEEDKVKHLGLSKNYRLPYKHRVSDLIKQEYKDINGQNTEGLDMVETLFGYTENSTALKGRVCISHAFCTKNIPDQSFEEKSGVMGQPQASFTPLYLKQNKFNHYVSYNDAQEIAGRKRYRTHANNYITQIPAGNGNEKTITKLTLLPIDNDFEVAIAVHNLKPCEIGLILSALTFHNTQKAHHNIGMGKSFGYGKVEVSNIRLEGLANTTVEHYLMKFEKVLREFTKNTQMKEWSETEQVKMLVAMALDHKIDLELMTLDEYTEAKKDANYSHLSEPTVDNIGLVLVNNSKLIEQINICIEQNKFEEAHKILKELEGQDEVTKLQARILEKTKQMNYDSNISKADELAKEAKTFYDAKDYQNAKAKYEEAHNLGVKNFDVDIQKCEQVISMTGQTFEEYLEKAKMQSIGAFTGYIKKWTKDLADNDKKLVIGKIEKFIEGKNKNKVKDWIKLLADYKKQWGYE